MGDPKRPKNKYENPRKPWEKDEITQRKELCKKYGLKNRRELLILQAYLKRKRIVARKLLAVPLEKRVEQQRALIESLEKVGLLKKDATIDDVLGIKVEGLLERRLQTIVVKKGLARTMRQSRQLITHGHISVGGRIVSAPGYLVLKREEDTVKFADPKIGEKIMAIQQVKTKSRGGSDE
ncbi:MAG: 30S ribosomal protein S4 [Candidatus Diapherotrites archaeon]|nr:30S ribosomal protein S4 [Candidatus Diapherotrites archaeon]